MKTLITILLLSFSGLTFALRTTLSPKELKALKAGKEITRVEELEDEVFPRVTLVNVIPNSPRENMEIFSDFESHKNFIPGLRTSKIVKREGNITDVFFEMEMPIISNTEYTTRHKVAYEDDAAILTWNLLKSDQVKRTKGMIMFEEFEGKTLFTYVSHITPKSSLAWTVKGRVVPDVKKTIDAVIKHLKTAAQIH